MTTEEQEKPLSQDEVRAVAQEGYADPVRFCHFFLPHLFPGPIPWVHRGILSILTGQTDFLWNYGEIQKIESNFVWRENPDDLESPEHPIFLVDYKKETIDLELGRYTLIMMPRGSAKTTIAGIAIPLYEILYQEVPFTIYVSEAAPHAKMQLHNVQRELIDNRRIRAVFGDLKPALRDDERWSGDFFETKTGIAFAARGRGGQIRGALHRGQRPTKIICDDLEDKESVDTEHQREKTRTWAYGDLMPALPEVEDVGGGKATIVALGTLLHREALLMTWQKDEEWSVVQFGAFDKEGEPIWEAFMDRAKYERRKRSFAAAAQLHTFYMEYDNKYVAPEQQVFRPEYFRYNPIVEDLVHSAVYIDPAISAERHADDTAIVAGGITSKGIFKVLDVEGGRGMKESEKVDAFFALSKKWNADQHGVESNGYQGALKETLHGAMFRKKQYFEITAIPHKNRKTARIKGVLQPRFAAGYVEFRTRWPKLESELLDFREDLKDQADDYADALAGCLALLDPYAALEASGEGKDLGEDEMPPLEEVFDGDWRTH